MTRVLIDTSVLIKWFHSKGESELDAARALRSAHLRGEIQAHVIDLAVYEVGNVLSLRVDGRLLASFTDTERPYVRGAVALYDEDAHARFTGVAVTPVNR